MASAQALIDKATKVCSSRYALAQRLHVDESNLGKVYRGTIPMPPALAARIAAIAGEDPATTALEALAEREKDPTTRQELARLFKLAPAAAALAVTVLLGATSPTAEAASIDAHAPSTGDRLYIMSTRLRRFLIRIFAAIHDTLHPHHLRHAALTA